VLADGDVGIAAEVGQVHGEEGRREAVLVQQASAEVPE
jgi:hypothetical protein